MPYQAFPEIPIHSDSVLVIDLETTGTNEKCHEILEIGVLIANANLTQEIAWYQTTVFYFPSDVGKLYGECDPFVQEMHHKNGLWEALEVPGSGKTLEVIGREVCQMIRHFYGPDVKPVCAGNNVESFDKRFIKAWIPELFQALHYRTINISSLRESVKREYGVEVSPEGAVAHRAIDDCRSSMRLYRYCIDLLRNPPTDAKASV